MNKKKTHRHRDILFILISSFILVLIWIGSNLYHIWASSTINEDVQSKLQPISASFDLQTLQNLKKRTRINPQFEKQSNPQAPTQTPSPTASASAVQGDRNSTVTP